MPEPPTMAEVWGSSVRGKMRKFKVHNSDVFFIFFSLKEQKKNNFHLEDFKSYTTSNIIICCIKYAFLRHFYLYKEIMSTHNLNVAWSMFNWYTWNGSTNTLFCFQCINIKHYYYYYILTYYILFLWCLGILLFKKNTIWNTYNLHVRNNEYYNTFLYFSENRILKFTKKSYHHDGLVTK